MDRLNEQAIRASLDAATGGVWSVQESEDGIRVVSDIDSALCPDEPYEIVVEFRGCGVTNREKSDAEFIANSKSNMRLLLSALIDAYAEIDRQAALIEAFKRMERGRWESAVSAFGEGVKPVHDVEADNAA